GGGHGGGGLHGVRAGLRDDLGGGGGAAVRVLRPAGGPGVVRLRALVDAHGAVGPGRLVPPAGGPVRARGRRAVRHRRGAGHRGHRLDRRRGGGAAGAGVVRRRAARLPRPAAGPAGARERGQVTGRVGGPAAARALRGYCKGRAKCWPNKGVRVRGRLQGWLTPTWRRPVERELWSILYPLLRRVGNDFSQKYVRYQPWVLVAVTLCAALHDRPISWACDAR